MNPQVYATSCLSINAPAQVIQKCPGVRSNARILVLCHNYARSRRLADLVSTTGYCAIAFETPLDLLNSSHLQPPCCVLLEHNSTHATGLNLQQELAHRLEFIPVIVLSESSSLAMGIAAMKAGAVDYLVQPAEPAAIAEAIKTALAKQAKSCEFTNRSLKFRQGWQKLTIREREVLSFIIDGFLNKQIAAQLGISEKTIKVHRGRVMKKMQVASFAELVRLAERASIAETLSNGYVGGRSRLTMNAGHHTKTSTSLTVPTPECLLYLRQKY